MGLLGGLFKVALSPVRGVAEVIEDLSGNNGESEQITSIMTAGTYSIIKGISKGIKEGAENIFEE